MGVVSDLSNGVEMTLWNGEKGFGTVLKIDAKEVGGKGTLLRCYTAFLTFGFAVCRY